LIGGDVGDRVVQLLLGSECSPWYFSFEASCSWIISSSRLAMVVLLITVASEMSSFPTIEAKAFFTSSLLLYLGESLVLVLVILMMWVLYMSEIADLGWY
jgi:hypothetical protein